MKTQMIAATLVSCLAGTAQAQDVFGDAAGCARHRGEPVNTDMLFLFDLETIERHESTCPVTGAIQVGGGATLLTVTCTGEGAEWDDFYMLETTSDPDMLVIYPEEFEELRTELRLCE